MLEWTPGIFRVIERDGRKIEVKEGNEPSGWFRRQCEAAGCMWFYTIVERMAAGVDVSLGEIKQAYRNHSEGVELEQKSILELM